jgi:hypothetical protein
LGEKVDSEGPREAKLVGGREMANGVSEERS